MTEKVEKIDIEKKTGSRLPATTTSIEHYLAEISNHPVLSREEEYELAMRYKNDGDLDAARQLVTSNLKFVVKIANEYRNYGINMMDIIQEGNVGLMNAVKGFDPTKGYRLITYAVWWIRAYIQNYLIKSWSLVKIGTSQAQRKLFYKLRSTKSKFEAAEGEFDADDYSEIAKELGVSDKDVIEMDQRMGTKDLSLNSVINAEQGQTHLDFLTDEEINQEDVIRKSQQTFAVQDNIEEVLNSLKKRERFIVENRVLTDEPLTLEEIGNKYSISRERVRQIEKTALKKIKKLFKERGIEGIEI